MLPSTHSAPPSPTYIFRAHQASIHALHFFHHAQEHYFISGDGDGFVIVWRLLTRRPVAVWKAHEGGISGLKTWRVPTAELAEEDGVPKRTSQDTGQSNGPVEIRLISHGRDHKLRVWRLDLYEWQHDGEGIGSNSTGGDPRFLIESIQAGQTTETETLKQPWLLHSLAMNALNFCAFAVCLASPRPTPPFNNTLDTSSNDISSTSTRDEGLLIASPNGLDSSTIDIFHLPSEHRVSQIKSSTDKASSDKTGMVMCVDLLWSTTTSKAGSKSESEGSLILLAGYEDGSVQVFQRMSFRSPSEPPNWTWHITSRARVHSQPVLAVTSTPDARSFLTSSADAMIAKFALPASDLQSNKSESAPRVARPADAEMAPSRTVNTRHAGQQDLRIRGDGKVFATAGWDGMVRVYSVKSLKELAVLVWHGVGCYAVAFGNVGGGDEDGHKGHDGSSARGKSVGRIKEKVERQRVEEVYETHWLVAGSKDGKISLWDVY